MTARWLVVLFIAAALVAAPVVSGTRPAAPSDIPAVELAGRVRQSADVGWSGYVETSGTLQVPDNESFATLAQMLGGTNGGQGPNPAVVQLGYLTVFTLAAWANFGTKDIDD
jgi:hypothetical protein